MMSLLNFLTCRRGRLETRAICQQAVFEKNAKIEPLGSLRSARPRMAPAVRRLRHHGEGLRRVSSRIATDLDRTRLQPDGRSKRLMKKFMEFGKNTMGRGPRDGKLPFHGPALRSTDPITADPRHAHSGTSSSICEEWNRKSLPPRPTNKLPDEHALWGGEH